MYRLIIIITVFSALLTLAFLSLVFQKDRVVTHSPAVTSGMHKTATVTIPELTLEQFFDATGTAETEFPSDSIRTLVVTGDVIPGRSVNYKTLQYNNFFWAFEPTAHILRDGDITFVNLEVPLLSDCPVTNEGMKFCGDARHTQGLKHAGVDVVNLGNNHTGNYGLKGVQETLSHLRNANITSVGALNNPQFVNARGTRFAFLGYDDIEPQQGISAIELNTVQNEIKVARENADIVVVQFHWGTEYVSKPTDRQRELGRLSIDAGADLVIGNHPHWIQPIEIYKNKLITYAHGNFIFDQMWSEKTQEGVIGKYYFFENRLIDAEFIPIRIHDYGQAQIISDSIYKDRILKEMYDQSNSLYE